METKVLAVAIVEDGDKVLMHKKADGSPPYAETWYIFGAELTSDKAINKAVIDEIKARSGVDVEILNRISWDTEVKLDLDGVEKFFVYLDIICRYLGGDLVSGEGVERLEWVAKNELTTYDIVPPSRILFQKLGYID